MAGFLRIQWCIFIRVGLKMDTVQPDTKLHVRLPLDDIIVGRYGLEGRLVSNVEWHNPAV